MRTVLVASFVLGFGAWAANARQGRPHIGHPMQPEASPRSETGVPAIEATPGASAPFSASANPILHVPVSGLHPGVVSFAPRIANPLASDPQATTRGMQDFVQFNCVGYHAANGAGGMGPALSEGQFIYGSSPANLFLSIYQGRPDGMPAWGELLPEFDDLGAGRLRRQHRPSAELNIRTNDLVNASLACSRADAVGIPADGEAMELHERFQQRPKAGRRVSAMRVARLTILSAALSAAFSPDRAALSPMDYLHADGLMAKRILPLTQTLLIVSAIVVVIIMGLVLVAILDDADGAAPSPTPRLRRLAGGDGFRSASAFRQLCWSAWSSGLQ